MTNEFINEYETNQTEDVSIHPFSIISHESKVVSQMVLAVHTFKLSQSHMLTSLSSFYYMLYTSSHSSRLLPKLLL